MKRICPPADLDRRASVLRELEPRVEELIQEHLDKRRLWFPADLVGPDNSAFEGLVERARGFGDGIRVALALNLTTEEGLPHFHRLLYEGVGSSSVWVKWGFLWTAEEDRHGCAIRDYVRDAEIFRQREFEALQHAYVESGFVLPWAGDPYKVLVYTTLQERATWLSHKNTGKLAEDEPMLRNLLTRIAAEEARHYTFYRESFRMVLEVDPNEALKAALFLLPAIEMPGSSMPGFNEMAEVAWHEGIYGPREYAQIANEAIDSWKIADLDGLDDEGKKAQEAILKLPKRLAKVADFLENRREKKSFSFEFLPHATAAVA